MQEATVQDKAPSSKKKKRKEYTKGVETMFRITSRNHINLSEMADNKANIMITVNTTIISLFFYLIYRFYVEGVMIIPTTLFMLTSLGSVLFAILATLPNITKGTFSREEVMQGKTNLLFFGNFHEVSLEEFQWGMKYIMETEDAVYQSMVMDIHLLGKVLARKYKLLRISYTIFMIGIVISSITFLVLMNIYGI
ncbi:Pycsar system effector family protein [Limibacter armeniacum]|uniref:Pycsar system effector family protein n=1 Tax=Limibacter armeniacum TaxID=466084 RepID=UPI002FE68FA7